MANQVTNRQLNVYIQSGDAQKVYDKLIEKQNKLNAELAQTSTHPKRIKAINDELAKMAEPIDRAKKKLSGELLPTFRDLEASTRKWMNEFKKTGDPQALENFAKFTKQLSAAKGEIDKIVTAQNGIDSKGFFSAAFWANLASGAVTKAISTISGFFNGMIEESLNADESTQRLKSTLDNLGKGESFDRITKKAQQLADKFKYLDNDDIVAVFNKLIDYGKLTEQQMNQLLPVIIDFSAKSKTSLSDSADVIIKAIGGNGKALKEYGINIKDTGTEGERFNTIMTTLKEKVDGSGEAFMKSAKGGIMTARQEFKNLQEDIGNLVIPVLNKLLGWVVKALNSLKSFAQSVRESFAAGRGTFTLKSTSDIIDEIKNNEIPKKQADAALEKAKAAWDEERIKRQDEMKLILGAGPGPDKADKTLKDTKNNIHDLEMEIQKLKAEFLSLNELDKALGELDIKFKTIADKAAGNNKLLREIEQIHQEARLKLIQDFARKEVETWQKNQVDINKKADEVFTKNLTVLKGIEERMQKELETSVTTALDNRLAARQLSVLQAEKKTGKERLAAELNLLKEQESQELGAKELTEQQKLLIEETYRKKRQKAETDFVLGQINAILTAASQSLDVLKTFGDAKTNRENAELARDQKINDQKKLNLEKRLKSGTITQLEYQRELDKMDKDRERKEKEFQLRQFKRNQAVAIAQALINGAQGVVSTFAARPGLADIFTLGVARAIQVGIIAAATAAQIASISSQKPQFAKGGILDGRSHAEGGNPILDGNGRKIAEIERGEGIVNKKTMADRNRYSLSGTPSQIASMLNAMHGGVHWESGASILPGWATRKPTHFNYPVIKKYYAGGGIFDSNGSAPLQGTQPDPMLLEMMARTLNVLSSLEKNGVIAYTILSDNEKQQSRLDTIRSEATIKP